MGAIGIAILAKNKNNKIYDLNIKDIKFETKGMECNKCPNNCEIIMIRKDKELIDSWGNRCEKGTIRK